MKCVRFVVVVITTEHVLECKMIEERTESMDLKDSSTENLIKFEEFLNVQSWTKMVRQE